MHIMDHVLVIVLALVHPVVGFVSFRRLLRRAAAGEPVDRLNLYHTSIATQWLLFAIVLITWLTLGRSLDTLGFAFVLDGRFMLSAVLALAAVVLLGYQLKSIGSVSSEKIRDYRGQIGALDIILPRNGNELVRFNALSITAGIVEETLWRGFMIWYFSLFMPVWAAAMISAIGFGIAHAYQGTANLPKIVLVGAAFAGLYLLSGSLLLPMILHAAVDILQGRLGHDIIRRDDNEHGPTTPQPAPATPA